MQISSAMVVLALPALALLMLALGWRRPYLATRVALPAVIGTFFAAIVTLVTVATQGPVTIAFPSRTLAFTVDRLAAVMMVLISGVGIVIYRFSMNYMFQERGYLRYHLLLVAATFTLLCMVSSANLLLLFVFWQAISWLLTLLSYNYQHEPTLQGAFRTFTTLRFGDVAFLAGIVLAQALYGTLEFQPLFERLATASATVSLLPGVTIDGATAVTLLLFVGAMTKSAQVPLHVWLPQSLFAPTPVHALLHAGIINAGGFLINRLAPLFGHAPVTLHVAFAVGVVTALLAAFMMLTQNDIKKTLGHSTIGQMGYMIMECGLGAFALAIFHLVAHGLFKATVFLHCGNVIHKARQEPKFPHGRTDDEEADFSFVTWLTGFLTTLILPLAIVAAAHGLLQIPVRESQGTLIFLFLSWVTSAQAILTLYRLRAVASWKVALTMLGTLVVVIFTYLWAAESFTHFLYPGPGEAAGYFRAAALPGWLFDTMVGAFAAMIITGWVVLYSDAQGRSFALPAWTQRIRMRLYLLFLNRLYAETIMTRLGAAAMRFAHAVDRKVLGWLP